MAVFRVDSNSCKRVYEILRVAVAMLCLVVFSGISADKALAGKITYVYTDPHGSPLAEADENGVITASYDYKPYGGSAMNDSSDGVGFTGHVNDKSTGLIYMQARYYDPNVGRFLSVDADPVTAGFLFNFNRYKYASNNPVVFIDADGRQDGLAAERSYGLGVSIALRNDPEKLAAVRRAEQEARVTGPGAVEGMDMGSSVVNFARTGDYSTRAVVTTFMGMVFMAVSHARSPGRPGSYRPPRTLPRDQHGNPIPDTNVPHTQLGTKEGRNGDYTQAREWGYDENGNLVPKRDIDFTDHGRPNDHPDPHQHDYIPNPSGGTPQRGPTKPVEPNDEAH